MARASKRPGDLATAGSLAVGNETFGGARHPTGGNDMNPLHPVSLPVLLATNRQDSTSMRAAWLLADMLNRRPSVRSEVLDLTATLRPIDPMSVASERRVVAAAIRRADGLLVVAPEHNHDIAAVIDRFVDEFARKAVGLVSVSSRPFGGLRAVQSLLPLLLESGLAPIVWDVTVGSTSAAALRAQDESVVRRSERFIDELIWLSMALRHGRMWVRSDDRAAASA